MAGVQAGQVEQLRCQLGEPLSPGRASWPGTPPASPRPAPRRRAARGTLPSENSGVRSSCDALAMNSRRARSRRARPQAHPVEGTRELADLVLAVVDDRLVERAARRSAPPPVRAGGSCRANSQAARYPTTSTSASTMPPAISSRCRATLTAPSVSRSDDDRSAMSPFGSRNATSAYRVPPRSTVPVSVFAGEDRLDRNRVVVDVGRRLQPERVLLRGEEQRLLGEDRVDDDPGADDVGRVGGEHLRSDVVGVDVGEQPGHEPAQVVDLAVDQPALERRDHDQVDERQRPGHDEQEREAEPGADAAGAD